MTKIKVKIKEGSDAAVGVVDILFPKGNQMIQVTWHNNTPHCGMFRSAPLSRELKKTLKKMKRDTLK